MRSCTIDYDDSPLGSDIYQEYVSLHLLGSGNLLKVNSFPPVGVVGFFLIFSQKVIRCGGRYLLIKTFVESTTDEKTSFVSFSLAVAIFYQYMLMISLNSAESMWMFMEPMLLPTSTRIMLKSDYSFARLSSYSCSLIISMLRASLIFRSSPQYCSFILAITSLLSRQMSSMTALYLLYMRQLSLLASFFRWPIRYMTSYKDFRYCSASPTILEQTSYCLMVISLFPFWFSSTAQLSQYKQEASPSTLNLPCFSLWLRQREGGCMNLAYNDALGARNLLLSGWVEMRLDALDEWEGERWVTLSDLGLLWKQLVMLASGSLPFLGEGCGFSSFMFFIQNIVIYGLLSKDG